MTVRVNTNRLFQASRVAAVRSAFREHVFEDLEEIKRPDVAADAAQFAIAVHQDHGRDHLDGAFQSQILGRFIVDIDIDQGDL